MERDRVVVSTSEPRESQRVALSRWKLLVGVGRGPRRGREGSRRMGDGALRAEERKKRRKRGELPHAPLLLSFGPFCVRLRRFWEERG